MSKRQELEERAKKAILEKSIYRWENAAVISLSLLLASFDGLFDMIPLVPWWGWLVGGTVAAGALFYSSLTDPQTAAQAVSEMLRDDFRPEKLKDKRLQAKINEALSYHTRIAQTVQERGEGSMIGGELTQVLERMDEWIEEVYGLAERLDRYRQDSGTLGANRQRATVRLAELQQRRKGEGNAKVREELDKNIESLQYQLQTLNAIDETMQRAELLLDNKLTAMGTIYLQSTLAGVKEIDSGRAKRLQQEIASEVQEMDDILVTLDEVYATSTF
jgi:hypothetical protein